MESMFAMQQRLRQTTSSNINQCSHSKLIGEAVLDRDAKLLTSSRRVCIGFTGQRKCSLSDVM